MLWFADKLIRLARTTAVHSGMQAKVLSVEHFGGVTRVVLSGEAFEVRFVCW